MSLNIPAEFMLDDRVVVSMPMIIWSFKGALDKEQWRYTCTFERFVFRAVAVTVDDGIERTAGWQLAVQQGLEHDGDIYQCIRR